MIIHSYGIPVCKLPHALLVNELGLQEVLDSPLSFRFTLAAISICDDTKKSCPFPVLFSCQNARHVSDTRHLLD